MRKLTVTLVSLSIFSILTIFLFHSLLDRPLKCANVNHLHQICHHHPIYPISPPPAAVADQCIPPLRPFEKRFRAAPRYKLNFCAIEKNMSTVMTAILCFLFDEEQFRAGKRAINREVFERRLCKHQNEAFSMEEVGTRFNVSRQSLARDWLHLAIVRDPLDRFLSGFVDKCVLERSWLDHPLRCNGCRNNLSCFLHSQFQRMRRFALGQERLNSFDDRHFFPQNWRCQFHNHFRHFTFIPYSPSPQGVDRFFSTLFTIFRARGVSEQSIEFIRNQTAQHRTRHSTWWRRERQRGEQLLRENAGLMQLIVRMYYYDFRLFGYPLPQL